MITARATAAGLSVGCSRELADQEYGHDQDQEQDDHGVQDVPEDAHGVVAIGSAERDLQQNDRWDGDGQRPQGRAPGVFDQFGPMVPAFRSHDGDGYHYAEENLREQRVQDAGNSGMRWLIALTPARRRAPRRQPRSSRIGDC